MSSCSIHARDVTATVHIIFHDRHPRFIPACPCCRARTRALHERNEQPAEECRHAARHEMMAAQQAAGWRAWQRVFTIERAITGRHAAPAFTPILPIHAHESVILLMPRHVVFHVPTAGRYSRCMPLMATVTVLKRHFALRFAAVARDGATSEELRRCRQRCAAAVRRCHTFNMPSLEARRTLYVTATSRSTICSGAD